jgi:hypothetical protein
MAEIDDWQDAYRALEALARGSWSLGFKDGEGWYCCDMDGNYLSMGQTSPLKAIQEAMYPSPRKRRRKK